MERKTKMKRAAAPYGCDVARPSLRCAAHLRWHLLFMSQRYKLSECTQREEVVE